VLCAFGGRPGCWFCPDPGRVHSGHARGALGPDGVAIGSDFDGAVVPAAIGDAGGLQRIVAAMDAHGYDEDLLTRLCHANWLALLDRCWHGAAGC
jgi:membrane dipeptidase